MPSSAYSRPATYSRSLHDALPIYEQGHAPRQAVRMVGEPDGVRGLLVRVEREHDPAGPAAERESGLAKLLLPRFDRTVVCLQHLHRSEEHTSEFQSLRHLVCRLLLTRAPRPTLVPYTTLFRSTSRGMPHARLCVWSASQTVCAAFSCGSNVSTTQPDPPPSESPVWRNSCSHVSTEP